MLRNTLRLPNEATTPIKFKSTTYGLPSCTEFLPSIYNGINSLGLSPSTLPSTALIPRKCPVTQLPLLKCQLNFLGTHTCTHTKHTATRESEKYQSWEGFCKGFLPSLTKQRPLILNTSPKVQDFFCCFVKVAITELPSYYS